MFEMSALESDARGARPEQIRPREIGSLQALSANRIDSHAFLRSHSSTQIEQRNDAVVGTNCEKSFIRGYGYAFRSMALQVEHLLSLPRAELEQAYGSVAYPWSQRCCGHLAPTPCSLRIQTHHQ